MKTTTTRKKTVAHCWRERRILCINSRCIVCVVRTSHTKTRRHDATTENNNNPNSLTEAACVSCLFYYILCVVDGSFLAWNQTNTHTRARGVRVRCGCYHHLSIRDYKHTMAHCVVLIKSFLFEFWYAIFHHKQATYGQSPTQNTLQQLTETIMIYCVCVFFVRPIRRINLRIRQAYLSRTLSSLRLYTVDCRSRASIFFYIIFIFCKYTVYGSRLSCDSNSNAGTKI